MGGRCLSPERKAVSVNPYARGSQRYDLSLRWVQAVRRALSWKQCSSLPQAAAGNCLAVCLHDCRRRPPQS